MNKRLLLLGFFALLALGFNSCTKPTKKLTFYLDANIINHTALVQFTDLKTNTRVSNVSVTITGPDADYVYSINADKRFRISDGVLQLGFDPNRAITAANPLRFNIIAESGDYLKINKAMVIVPTDTQKVVDIAMVNTDAPPAGIRFYATQKALNSNTLADDYTVGTTADGTVKVDKLDVTVPEGTKFKDANNNELSGTALRVSLAHFDARGDETTLAAYPGGLDPLDVVLPDGTTQSVNFESAGFASIDMEVSGGGVSTPVKHFSKPVTVTMTLSKDVKNPATGAPLTVGSKMPIWSYDVETGIWKHEVDATVQNDGDNYKVSFETMHLTWYNMDYYGTRCSQTAEFTINAPWLTSPYELLMKVYSASTGAYLTSTYLYVYNGSKIGYYNAPNQNVILKFYDYSQWWLPNLPLLGQLPALNMCSLSGGTITLPQFAVPPVINFDVFGTCPYDPDRKVRASMYIYYKPTGSNYWDYLGYLNMGKMSTHKLTAGQTYTFGTYFNGQWYEATIPVTANTNTLSMEIPSGFCD